MAGHATVDGPYHAGELSVQERAGERWRAERTGRIVTGSIPSSAREFVARQYLAVLGSRSRDGRVWASLLFGSPGFLDATDPRTLEIDLDRALGHPLDPLHVNLARDPGVGVLLIELETRRRLRVNGRAELREGRLRVSVEEAYPNCPKYIQRRRSSVPVPCPEEVPASLRTRRLNSAHRAWIAAADTFFVASAHPERGVDASHRGGPPGFVQVVDERTLRIPDYSGNGMFNTLGNLALNPAAGLLFPDFEGDRTLQLAGTAELRWDLDDPDGSTGGTNRFWDFMVDRALEVRLPLRSAWEFLDYSPHNPEGSGARSDPISDRS